MTAPATTTRVEGPLGLEDAVARLRRTGGRVTDVRRALLADLHAAPGRVTADELIGRHPEADPATVYRALVQFEAAGIVEHVHLGHGPAAYRWAGEGSFTAVCHDCGRTFEIPAGDAVRFVSTVRRRHDFALDLGHFALSGRCGTCRRAGR